MESVILQVFYAVFSGVLEGIAIPNEFFHFGLPSLALISLVPLYIALYKAKSYKEAFLMMFCQTLTVHLISSFWLANFRDFAIFTLGASALGTAFEGGMIGIIFFTVISSSKNNLSSSKRIFWFTSCFVIYEWMKSIGYLGYPWGTLFLAAYKWKIITQIVSITGVYGVSFLFALLNAIIAEKIFLMTSLANSEFKKSQRSHRQKFSRPMLVNDLDTTSFMLALKTSTVIFTIVILYGTFQFFIPRYPEKYIQTILVQQNADPWETGEEASIKISKKLTESAIEKLWQEGHNADLVLWSEGVLSHSFPSARIYYENHPEDESLCSFIERMNVPFIIGGQTIVDKEKKHYCNSAIFFDAKGNYSGFYSKIHLVPFAESIPFSDNPIVQSITKSILGFSSGWTEGKQYVIFKVPIEETRYLKAPLEYKMPYFSEISLDFTGRSNITKTEEYIENKEANPNNFVSFSVPICFEDAFPDVCRKMFNFGSEVFMNITNDSWSKTASAEYQHFAIASYLAMEYRTTLVRCANSGYSVVVDPAGRVLKDMPIFIQDSTSYRVPVYKHKATTYSVLGDFFVYMLLFYVLTSILISVLKEKNFKLNKKIKIEVKYEIYN